MGVNGEALQVHAVYKKKNNIFFTTSHTKICTSNAPFYTVDRENFAVKIILQSRPTTEIKHAKIKLRSDDQ